jgi:hypothetical protein
LERGRCFLCRLQTAHRLLVHNFLRRHLDQKFVKLLLQFCLRTSSTNDRHAPNTSHPLGCDVHGMLQLVNDVSAKTKARYQRRLPAVIWQQAFQRQLCVPLSQVQFFFQYRPIPPTAGPPTPL